MKARIGIILATLSLLLPAASYVRADEKSDLLAKQKAAAEAKWKKLDIEKTPVLHESANFLLFARLPEAKAKALAATLEKQYVTALKALKYEGDDRPWQGKLAVFVFSERPEFVDFMRKVEKKSPKEDEASSFTFSDESTLIVGVPKGDKAEPEAHAKLELAAALLKRKMGTGEPPDWVVEGFAKSTEYRAANPSAKGKPNWNMPNVPLSELWGDKLTPAVRRNYAGYVIDYLAYGPLSDQFPAFVEAFRADEAGNPGTADAALKAINLDAPTLAYYAKTWAKPKAPKPKK